MVPAHEHNFELRPAGLATPRSSAWFPLHDRRRRERNRRGPAVESFACFRAAHPGVQVRRRRPRGDGNARVTERGSFAEMRISDDERRPCAPSTRRAPRATGKSRRPTRCESRYDSAAGFRNILNALRPVTSRPPRTAGTGRGAAGWAAFEPHHHPLNAVDPAFGRHLLAVHVGPDRKRERRETIRLHDTNVQPRDTLERRTQSPHFELLLEHLACAWSSSRFAGSYSLKTSKNNSLDACSCRDDLFIPDSPGTRVRRCGRCRGTGGGRAASRSGMPADHQEDSPAPATCVIRFPRAAATVREQLEAIVRGGEIHRQRLAPREPVSHERCKPLVDQAPLEREHEDVMSLPGAHRFDQQLARRGKPRPLAR